MALKKGAVKKFRLNFSACERKHAQEALLAFEACETIIIRKHGVVGCCLIKKTQVTLTSWSAPSLDIVFSLYWTLGYYVLLSFILAIWSMRRPVGRKRCGLCPSFGVTHNQRCKWLCLCRHERLFVGFRDGRVGFSIWWLFFLRQKVHHEHEEKCITQDKLTYTSSITTSKLKVSHLMKLERVCSSDIYLRQ